ncbi:MAG: hypothetical protein O6649_08720 [Gammaproteobacteria bacterium]|nr:hypothetical protein [Gammaproteobacteria bacterium]
MNKSPENGDRRMFDDIEYIFYYDYWMRYYAPMEDTLSNRKRLIDSLTRRAFHHTEAGINTPGRSLEQARAAYQAQTNPQRKRVNAAMLAGSLFHRATDLFTSIVNLEELGVTVSKNNELMRECTDCFEEALALGKQVKHHSGCEGIDEIWGEPFKAFTMTPTEFYQSRFIKIAQSMRDIDRIGDYMVKTFASNSVFGDAGDTIMSYTAVAKRVSDTMKKDPIIFRIWPEFVALAEELDSFEPNLPANADQMLQMKTGQGMALLREGKRLVGYIAGARVPMPLGTERYIEKCRQYQAPLITAKLANQA